MTQQLTESTKQTIKHIVDNLVDKQIESFPFYFSNAVLNEEYEELNQKALEELEQEFDKVESNYDLLKDYYDESGDCPDYETLKHLSLQYAESLI